mmetsp:Transcript_33985/g.66927  ORF Transcript_33985/g.66927 Transcript_33985/m.66927 type:complete len:327 (-) Transcript_33985:98-1078(-)
MIFNSLCLCRLALASENSLTLVGFKLPRPAGALSSENDPPNAKRLDSCSCRQELLPLRSAKLTRLSVAKEKGRALVGAGVLLLLRGTTAPVVALSLPLATLSLSVALSILSFPRRLTRESVEKLNGSTVVGLSLLAAAGEAAESARFWSESLSLTLSLFRALAEECVLGEDKRAKTLGVPFRLGLVLACVLGTLSFNSLSCCRLLLELMLWIELVKRVKTLGILLLLGVVVKVLPSAAAAAVAAGLLLLLLVRRENTSGIRDLVDLPAGLLLLLLGEPASAASSAVLLLVLLLVAVVASCLLASCAEHSRSSSRSRSRSRVYRRVL